ncbi:MAG: hypothetical protein PHV34_17585 [Verrucomicrobiae bacterium]|nr:hypothetical protein [Verrucomicrobiae bacterium]
MSLLAANTPTLLDYMKSLDPQGKPYMLAELLSATNEILLDMPFVEANNKMSHNVGVRTGLPGGYWRMYNLGVLPEKADNVELTETCGMFEARNRIDARLVERNGNGSAFRISQDRAFIIGSNKTMATSVFYGNQATDRKQFTGLAPRFNDATAQNAGNIINGGGTGSTNTSIWLVVWDSETVSGFYPEGSKAGLDHKDEGRGILTDSQGREHAVYRSCFQWDIGMYVKDWRYIVRCANIDVTTLGKSRLTGADIVDLMTQMLERVEDTNMGRAAFYCNRTIRGILRRQISNTSNVNLSESQVAGKRVVMFDDIPVRRCDAIVNTEEAITGLS